MISPFMDERTRGKINFVWGRESLARHFDLARVPASLGGGDKEEGPDCIPIEEVAGEEELLPAYSLAAVQPRAT